MLIYPSFFFYDQNNVAHAFDIRKTTPEEYNAYRTVNESVNLMRDVKTELSLTRTLVEGLRGTDEGSVHL